MDKIEIARRQLGAALDLFIRHKDPVSVQCLSCGACEVIESLATHAGLESFTNYLISAQPDITIKKFRELRSLYWNAFKHFSGKDRTSVRDDGKIIAQFSDVNNDDVLFIGWSDYALQTGKMPVAAQVFQVWYFTLYEERMAPDIDLTNFRRIFPEMNKCDRSEQKRRLKRAIEKYQAKKDLLSADGTDPRPLTLGQIAG